MAVRRGPPGELPAFYCGQHARRDDRPLPPAGPLLRVRAALIAEFAGTAWQPSEAETDVVASLEAAVRGIWGLPHVYAVTSTLGRFAVQPAKATRTPSSGGQG